ncbi:extracellular solute-binding protein, partial [Nguyenibacter vanlangensis]
MRRRVFMMAAGLLPWAARARGGRTVDVLYAGSLLTAMERGIGPAFDATGTDVFRGYAGGSGALANQIAAGLRRADIYISADPALNLRLGPAHGDHVRWYAPFAQSPLVLGYDPRGRFAAALQSDPWYLALQRPGVRIGRTDPLLDPKGALTVKLLHQAETYYRQPGLADRILHAGDGDRQVRPEENLVGRLQSGQIDVGFFYATETAALHIPAMTLPPALALSARYTVTILRDAPNPEGAERLVAFLLGARGRTVLAQYGLQVPGPHEAPAVMGDPAAVPPALRPLLRP